MSVLLTFLEIKWGQVKCSQPCIGALMAMELQEAEGQAVQVEYVKTEGRDLKPLSLPFLFPATNTILSQRYCFVEAYQVRQKIFAGKISKSLLIGRRACFLLSTGKDIFY